LGLNEPAVSLPKIELDQSLALVAPPPLEEGQAERHDCLEVPDSGQVLELQEFLVRVGQLRVSVRSEQEVLDRFPGLPGDQLKSFK
jgi:hypothetical protein